MGTRGGIRMMAAVLVAAGLAASPFLGQTASGPVDWNYARTLLEKERTGQTLPAQERAYLDRAKEVRSAGSRPASRPAVGPATRATGLVPLDELSAAGRYKGQDGGLYGSGQNRPPRAHQQAAERELAGIVPLDGQGKPSADGKIVLLSMGMSNTTQEFSRFKELADKDPAKSPAVVIVDGAQGGRDAADWADKNQPVVWETVDKRLAGAGVTAAQVQAVWLKQALKGSAQYGDFPKHAQALAGHILTDLNLARQRFANLRVAYLSSRIYAGYASTPLNPEPYAYESAFAVRDLILRQIKGEEALNFEPAKGKATSPLLLWGPYLWADGMTPRKGDGLIWQREDLAGDGTHPSPASGRQKVAALLLEFFKNDPNAKGWFCKKP